MESARLVTMANQIGKFFESQGDEAIAIAGIADHLKKFWDPRMRRELAEYLERGGDGVAPLVAAAVRAVTPTGKLGQPSGLSLRGDGPTVVGPVPTRSSAT